MDPVTIGNTLLSPRSIERILSLPRKDDVYGNLLEILAKFQDIKKFASEIHTEIHLVKPVLKNLGYAYESKPKFFEDQVKGPDVTLFATEEDREKSSELWGTKEYFERTLGILVLKRYGRNLKEGIGGFFLEFENKIPLYQTTYLLKKSRSPWGILTNGKTWMLLRRPSHFEERFIEIDIEAALLQERMDILHIFFHLFSLPGLQAIVPHLLEEERNLLIESLSRAKVSFQKSVKDLRKKVDIYPKAIDLYSQFVPTGQIATTEAYLADRGQAMARPKSRTPDIINEYDIPDLLTYLFMKKPLSTIPNLEGILTGDWRPGNTKDELLSLKILDMTPGFGNISVQLLETLAYLSFVLPYKEKNSFVSQWEDQKSLKSFICDNVLYGIERSHLAFDMLQNTFSRLSGAPARHYRFGNPLIGMSLLDISGAADTSQQMGLFGRNPSEVIEDLRKTYRHYSSLSAQIKEDLQTKNELQAKLTVYRDRIRDFMDLVTAGYFAGSKDQKRIQEMFFSLDSDSSTWQAFRRKDWFGAAKETAKRNGFFHFEIEFPFLLSDSFDFIFVQPFLRYSWEDDLPGIEVTKAYIKRGMTYLKPQGRMVLAVEDPADELVAELKKSRKYEPEKQAGCLIVKKKTP